MQLVVDTNILLSFFRDNPVRFIIINSPLLNLDLYSPEHCWKELLNIKPSISKYSKLSLEQTDSIFEELKKIIAIVPDDLTKQFESQAKELVHEKDTPIFALALKLNCTIWSNEPSFKQQSSVKIFNTENLRKFLNLI